jgi:hypothetical protein
MAKTAAVMREVQQPTTSAKTLAVATMSLANQL